MELAIAKESALANLIQEQDDALATIEWLAGRPCCLGKVGMIGMSWGGSMACR